MNEIPPYLQDLNEEQRAAVFHEGKPLLILAGAGSGKTRVVTTKIAYLIREKFVNPRSILAVTFTNKAAREMAERATAIESSATDAMLRTFHSFGAWFLRRNGEYAGLSSNFVIYDDEDMVTVLASIIEGKKKNELKLIAHQISRAKDYFFTPESADLVFINHKSEFRKIYAQYEDALRKTGNVDFGDLIKKPVEILRDNPGVAQKLHDRFRVIMVDEYQDANVAQFELLKAICSPETYVCVVGDDDQSIYRFRGAEVKNILEFPDRFGGADIIRLEKNYRSTSHILDVADSVVRRNTGRLGKELKAERGAGVKPMLAFLNDQDNEARECAALIDNSVRVKKNSAYSDWAVLYRTNAQSFGFENEFLRRKIPYRIVGSLKFYEREEIKDALALLSFVVNTKDEVSFRRVVNKPSRGIGASALEHILLERAAADWDIEAAAENSAQGLSAKARAGVVSFLEAINNARKTLLTPQQENGAQVPDDSSRILKAAQGLSRCVADLIENAGIAEYHRSHDEVSGETRVSNLQELVNGAVLYDATPEGLADFLERIALDRAIEQQDDGESRVTLITVHNTKGLEFRRVIMTGLEQGLFPRNDKEGDDLEEERRLFYVGATRAMDELYLTSCACRRVFGQTTPMAPSLFLEEVDISKMRIVGSPPYGFKLPSVKEKSGKAAGHKQKVSSDGRWRLGDRVFNEDCGYGEINAIDEDAEGPVITVCYENGRRQRFLSRAQSSRFMKIRD
ncbi:MAG: ATP-dependent helicase [Spirochaetaceae bacterium]|jgi:DNA helicase-2/ATP-dependent DNA helicase PcrA|nr:ATP-dependent helicase [Spirochaetaceae bacterium]